MEIIVWILYIAVALFLFWLGYRQIKNMGHSAKNKTAPRLPEKPLKTHKRQDGLQSDIFQEGSGPGAKNKDMLTVHYSAFLTSGEKVDSSYDRGRSLTFKLGSGKVIFGWDEALVGAKVGERRKITVPPEYAYGKKGTEKVPPNATVIFEVEVLQID